MQFQLPVVIKSPETKISYPQKILLTGSCFTKHIGQALAENKFPVLQNPNGILFDPASVCHSLQSYIINYQYKEGDLFYLNEVWNSWNHHSRFSNIDKQQCLDTINASQQQAHKFLKETGWLIITLGSSFSYLLTSEATKSGACAMVASPSGGGREGAGVANCHRAPAQWFEKKLSGIDEIIFLLEETCLQLIQFNPRVKIIFTISPVRHIRDGVVENNRSKARLIEAVHHLVNKLPGLYYFPAYELVMDVLRDYRFYDADLVHPNYVATEFVMEKFRESFIDTASQQIMDEIKKLVIARKHKPFHAATQAHKEFLKTHFLKTKELKEKYPFLDLTDELTYFASS
jgi:hypothetical protein